MKLYKKGITSETRDLIIGTLATVVLLVIVGLWIGSLIAQASSISNKDNETTYSVNNDYGFLAGEIGLLDDNGNKLTGSAAPTGCRVRSGSANTYNCLVGTSLNMYVKITNNGQKQRALYANPQVTWGCAIGQECAIIEQVDGVERCSIPIQGALECKTGANTFIVRKGNGYYRIYSGAICNPEDCAGSTTQTKSFNAQSYVTIYGFENNLP